ncbi:MAG TPA: hypothetical protein VF407_22210 [Polyangiaceae bacterium]
MEKGTVRLAWTMVTCISIATIALVCSSSSNESAGAGASGDTLGDAGVVPIRFDDSLCLPSALPTSGGETTCRILALEASGSCDGPGLTTPTSADVARANEDYAQRFAGASPSGTFCQVVQLAAGCVDGTSAGFCYAANGSCVSDAGCNQAVCTAPTFDAGATTLDLLCP